MLKLKGPITVACIATQLATGASGAVFTCLDASGHRTFTDLGCPIHTTPESDSPLQPATQFLPFAPLDETESARLAAMEKRLQEDARQRRRAQAARRSDRARDQARRGQRCAVVKTELRALQQQRRKGYSLAEAAALDAKDTALRAERASVCR